MSRRAPNWTPAEDGLLREHYRTRGGRWCADHLPGRPLSAIYQRAKVLGLKFERMGRAFKPVKWPPNEAIDAAIRETWQGKPTRTMVADLAKRTGYPAWWLKRRAVKLGVSVLREKEPRWSDAELRVLRRFAHFGVERIEKELAMRGHNRTRTAIVLARKRYSLSVALPEGTYSARGAGEMLGVDGKTVTAWIEDGLLRAEPRGTERKSDQWLIDDAALREFVVAHPQRIDLRKVVQHWFLALMTDVPPSPGALEAAREEGRAELRAALRDMTLQRDEAQRFRMVRAA